MSNWDEPPDIGDCIEIEWTRCEDCNTTFLCREDEPTICRECREKRDVWATMEEAREAV